jgi:Retron-type reverse transcriptase
VELLKAIKDFNKRDSSKGFDIIKLKDKSNLPKRSERINKGIFGLPKGGNSYGNRVTIVSLKNARLKRRVTANSIFKARHYSTDRAKNVINKLNYLQKLTQIIQPKESIKIKLYDLICDPNLLLLAYNNIKSKPGNMTPGIVPTTLDGMSIEKIKELSRKLKNEQFQFHPGRRVQIPKKSNKGGFRLLTISSPLDKIVQEAIRILLEIIFEPTFLKESHGFRPNKSCHTALKNMKEQFKSSS